MKFHDVKLQLVNFGYKTLNQYTAAHDTKLGKRCVDNRLDTYLAPGVGFPQALGLVCLFPGLEELFKHGRFCTFVHHLHISGGGIVFGFYKPLRENILMR